MGRDGCAEGTSEGGEVNGEASPTEALNERALAVISRVEAKLLGRDFKDREGPEKSALNVHAQVDRLVLQASYPGA